MKTEIQYKMCHKKSEDLTKFTFIPIKKNNNNISGIILTTKAMQVIRLNIHTWNTKEMHSTFLQDIHALQTTSVTTES